MVTGSSGFIARHLIKRLLSDGFEVVGIDDYSNSEPDKSWESQFEFHQQDITTLYPGHSLFHNVECIFHLAAKARVAPSFLDPRRYHDTNVTGTLNLLEACRQWKIEKFIFSSSSSVYGEAYMRSTGFREEQRVVPSSPYAFTKVQGESLCDFYKRVHKLNCIVLRYFNVYGDDQPSSGQYPQMLPYFLHLYEENKPFTIYGTGDQRRDFTFVEDIVEANLAALTVKDTLGSMIFNIGSGINHSVKEICDMIDPNHPRQHLPARIEPAKTLACNVEAGDVLNWKPTTTVEQWINRRLKKR